MNIPVGIRATKTIYTNSITRSTYGSKFSKDINSRMLRQ